MGIEYWVFNDRGKFLVHALTIERRLKLKEILFASKLHILQENPAKHSLHMQHIQFYHYFNFLEIRSKISLKRLRGDNQIQKELTLDFHHPIYISIKM